MTDIVDRLRATPRSDIREVLDEAADEITRLRSQPCPYVTGTVTHYCTLTPFTLADEEREAVERAADLIDNKTCGDSSTLRGLLERTEMRIDPTPAERSRRKYTRWRSRESAASAGSMANEMRAEISRLREEVARLRLTDEERQAVTAAIRWCEIDAPADGDIVSRYTAARAATLRGLLERTETGET